MADKTLSEAARQARNAYRRSWNRKNKDKVKAANRRYWEKKALEAREGDADERKQTESEIQDGGNPAVFGNRESM